MSGFVQPLLVNNSTYSTVFVTDFNALLFRHGYSFLRREKEIAEAKYEGLQAETNRLRQQTTQLSKQLDSTEEMLIQERDRIQVINQHILRVNWSILMK